MNTPRERKPAAKGKPAENGRERPGRKPRHAGRASAASSSGEAARHEPRLEVLAALAAVIDAIGR